MAECWVKDKIFRGDVSVTVMQFRQKGLYLLHKLLCRLRQVVCMHVHDVNHSGQYYACTGAVDGHLGNSVLRMNKAVDISLWNRLSVVQAAHTVWNEHLVKFCNFCICSADGYLVTGCQYFNV